MKSKLVVIFLTLAAACLLVIPQLRSSQPHSHTSQPFAAAAALDVNDPWIIECPDCPRQFADQSNRMLQLDSAGFPHIAYVGKGLYHAWYDGSIWHTETVPSAPGGFNAVLALDGDDHLHIIYSSAGYSLLKYVYQAADGWRIEDVGGSGPLVGNNPSLVLDHDGYPHVVYTQGGSDEYLIYYAYLDASGWHTQTVETTTALIRYTTLDLDQEGYPHLAYSIDFPVNELKYALQDASGWHIWTVAWGVCWYPSLVMDFTGYPHISYQKVSNPMTLRYLYQDGFGWHDEVVDTGSSMGYFTSLSLFFNGYAKISYTDGVNSLKYAYQDAVGWHTRLVDYTGAVFTSLAIDPIGSPAIVYMNGHSLKYTYLDAGKWYFHVVDTAGVVGSYTSIALDGNDTPHISYSDELFEQLKYAWRDSSGWHSQVVDHSYPGNTSLDLDAQGFPHIGYNDRYQLKYAYMDMTGWYTETVDDAWSVAGNSMQLDSNGYPHITYVKPGLMVAYKDTAGWHYQAIDDSALSVSLALDGAGYEHISYIHFGLNYAYQDASGWYTETVDASPDIGNFTSIALDSAGYPHISYTYITCPDILCYPSQLNHAWWDGSAWHTEAVDLGNNLPGSFNSIAIDMAGYPHIAHADLYLGYVYKDAAGWHSQVVNTSGDYPGYSSLALDSKDLPHISYYNTTRGEENYAHSLYEYLLLLPVVMRD